MASALPAEQSNSIPLPGRRRKKRAAMRRNLAAYMFMAPYLFILCVFSIGASLFGLGISLYHVDLGIDQPYWVGLKNYQYIWDQLWNNTDNFEFAIALKNIVVYAFFVIIGQTTLSLCYALLLNQKLRGRSLLRTLLYLPSVTSSVAISLIFVYLYDNTGAINALLSIVHIQGPDWLKDPATALPAIMGLNIFTTSPTFMIMFLAGLQGLPEQIYEAGKIDGCAARQLLWFITLPLLRPTIFVVVALGTIGSFQVFDQVAVMTQGGPLNSTLTPVWVIYDFGFRQHYFGLGAAMATILFAIILTITLIQRRFIDTALQY
jgi:multiple sugar transport system permease protein